MKLVSFLFSLVFIFITLIGCSYEKRLSIWSVFLASTWNPSMDKFVFARGYKIFKAPTGMARFPDGGRSKSLHESISFYIFDIKSGKIQRIVHFNDTRKCTLRQFWNIKINWEGNIITYSLETRVWDKERKVFREIDLGCYSFNTSNNSTISLIEKDKKTKIRQGKKKKDNIRLSSREIKKYTQNVTIEEWGIDPLDYCKLSNKDYIKDLMEFKGDREYRTAVIDRLGKELSKDEIKKILERFNKKMEKLKISNSYKHLQYTYSIEEIKRRLKIILLRTEE